MRFLFVDRISSFDEQNIRGTYSLPTTSKLAQSRNGVSTVPAGIVSEAIGQLASWLSLKNNDFSGKPVFLFADDILIHQAVQTGQLIELTANIKSMDRESFVFDGKAEVDGAVIHEVRGVNGYFIPLTEMEDPIVVQDRWNQLLSSQGLLLEERPSQFDWQNFWQFDSVSSETNSITVQKKLNSNLDFYQDHFPRMPVTPIVMINELIGGAASQLLQVAPQKLQPRAVSNIKIKSFWKPESTMTIKVRKLEEMQIINGREIETMAELLDQGKRILVARYRYYVED